MFNERINQNPVCLLEPDFFLKHKEDEFQGFYLSGSLIANWKLDTCVSIEATYVTNSSPFSLSSSLSLSLFFFFCWSSKVELSTSRLAQRAKSPAVCGASHSVGVQDVHPLNVLHAVEITITRHQGILGLNSPGIWTEAGEWRPLESRV